MKRMASVSGASSSAPMTRAALGFDLGLRRDFSSAGIGDDELFAGLRAKIVLALVTS
jgi:hypothetical protein